MVRVVISAAIAERVAWSGTASPLRVPAVCLRFFLLIRWRIE